MTNEAILSVLNSLCSEARNSAQAAFGLMELHRNAAEDSTLRASLEIGRGRAERLVRSIDDLRELLSSSPAAPELAEEFDLALCLRDAIELLNLASPDTAVPIRPEASMDPRLIRQDRHAVEQFLMRAL